MNNELNFYIPPRFLNVVSFFSAKKDIRERLNGVHIKPGRIEATDGYCLGRIDSADIKLEGVDCLIIPEWQVNMLLIMRGKHSPVSCVNGVAGSLVIEGVDATYPDTDRSIPAETSGETAQYDPELLMKFKKAAMELPGSKLCMKVEYNGLGPARVLINMIGGAFVGVIMPWKVR